MTTRRIPAGLAMPITGAAISREIVDLLGTMQAQHDRIVQTCHSLEDIADSLPLRANPRVCLDISRSLSPALIDSHQFEEQTFFPAVRDIFDDKAQFDAIVRRLCEEHREDQSYGEEVSESLLDWGLCAERHGAEVLGYMLRGFFSGMHRHIQFEQTMLIAPITTRLSLP